MIKSILSVVVGYFIMIISTQLMDVLIKIVLYDVILQISVSDSIFINIVSLLYYLAFACLSGYMTVKLSTHSELRHDLILGVMLIIQGIIIMGIDNAMPVWWHALYLLLVMPFILLGGGMRMKRHRLDMKGRAQHKKQ